MIPAREQARRIAPSNRSAAGLDPADAKEMRAEWAVMAAEGRAEERRKAVEAARTAPQAAPLQPEQDTDAEAGTGGGWTPPGL